RSSLLTTGNGRFQSRVKALPFSDTVAESTEAAKKLRKSFSAVEEGELNVVAPVFAVATSFFVSLAAFSCEMNFAKQLAGVSVAVQLGEVCADSAAADSAMPKVVITRFMAATPLPPDARPRY